MHTYTLHNPYLATLKKREKISTEHSSKEVYHLVIDIKDANLSYSCGDSAAILPKNDYEIVKKTLRYLHATGEEKIFDQRYKQEVSLQFFLEQKATITKFTPALLRLFLEYQKNSEKKVKLQNLLEKKNKDILSLYLQEHELWDVLKDFFSPDVPIQELCNRLTPLLPRLYSITSAQSVYKDEIHLLVSVISYTTSNIKRYGVTTRYLCHHIKPHIDRIPLYIHQSPNFHLPPNHADLPLIMLGAGTGIAPFRSFLQERKKMKAKGKNWLFFGERNQRGNFYYESFLTQLEKENFLRLSLAFSRDQKEKIYVQHLLQKQAKDVWEWIKKGAYIYVCGDAKAMARDIDKTFINIIKEYNSMNDDQARSYLRNLLIEKRYRRDIY